MSSNRRYTNARDFALVERQKANAHQPPHSSSLPVQKSTAAAAAAAKPQQTRQPHAQSYYPTSGYHGQPPPASNHAGWRAPPTFQPSTIKRFQLCRPVSSQPSVGGLYSDALFQILAFMQSTAELVAVAQCCRRWYNSVKKMHSLRMTYEAQRFSTTFHDDSTRLALMARSSLRHHIGSLQRVIINVPSFHLLHSLPHLTALKATLTFRGVMKTDAPPREELNFPKKLISLDLAAGSDSGMVAMQTAPAIVEAILRLKQLTSLRLPLRTYDKLHPSLESFEDLTFLELGSMSPAAAESIHKLPKLRVLLCEQESMSDALLTGRFLHGKHFLLGLEELSLGHVCVTPPIMDRLLTLPSLTSFQPHSLSESCYPDLLRFKRLKKLAVVEREQEGTEAGREILADVVRNLNRLRSFTFTSFRNAMTPEQIAKFELQLGDDIVRDPDAVSKFRQLMFKRAGS